MRKLNVIALVSVVFASCGSSTETQPTAPAATDVVVNAKTALESSASVSGGAEIVFEEEMFNFGKVKQGDEVSHVFKFKNTGDQPLVVEAKGSCGCTVPNAPKDPVAPGAIGELGVKVDTSNKRGQTSVTVYVTTNSVSAKRKDLKIVGEVLTEE